MDQLRQVLDRVDIVVRRRRDQTDSGHRIAQHADVLGHLAAGQLTAFAGLGALRHLDLDLVGAGQVLGGHAETSRRDLLDLRAQRIAGAQRDVADHALLAEHAGQRVAVGDVGAAVAHLGGVAQRVLAAFAGVALAADAVHRHRQRRVRLGRDRAQRHRSGDEALDDLDGRLDVVERDRARRVDLELEQPAQRQQAPTLVVDQLRVFLVGLVVVRPRRVLQLGDHVGGPQVFLAAHAPRVLAAAVERGGQQRVGAERVAVHAQRFLRDLEHADAADLARRSGEVLVDQVARQPDRLEDLRAAVAHVGRDTHLRHDLLQPLADRLDVVGHRFLGRELAGQLARQLGDRLQRQVGMHRFGAVAGEHRHMVHFARAAGLDDQPGLRAQPQRDQVLMHRAHRQQRRNRDALGAEVTVGDDQDVVAAAQRVDRLGADRRQSRLDALVAPGDGVADVDLVGAELAAGVLRDGAQLGHVGVV
ncbi:hypothetical protein GALL_394080 [mine drainage metagenome]|uniref:NAD-specific glutamate dehydrogenase n=1 Tax=mine drainage metagenome TaxID=410659 RepID=A0A1J5QFV6_9ZZZZ